MRSLHHQRIPIFVLLAGSGWIDASSLATRLAERLNLPCIIKTELIFELLSCIHKTTPYPALFQADLEETHFISRYESEAETILKALDVDLSKHVAEGKSFIMEGIHVSSGSLHYLEGCLSQLQRQGIIVPFLLVAQDPQAQAEPKHHHPLGPESNPFQQDSRYRSLQIHLLSHHSKGFYIVPIDHQRHSSIIDTLHGIILDHIKSFFHASYNKV